MARPSKPVELQSKHLTKEEIETRSKAEKMLKTTSDKVYKTPKHLNAETKIIYKGLVDKLKPLDILNDLDIDILCVTSDALYQMEVARLDIEKNGQVIYVRNDMGDIIKAIKNPSVEVFRAYENIFRSSCGQLCLSPSARAKLSAEIANVMKEENKEDDKKVKMTKEQLEIAWLTGGLS